MLSILGIHSKRKERENRIAEWKRHKIDDVLTKYTVDSSIFPHKLTSESLVGNTGSIECLLTLKGGLLAAGCAGVGHIYVWDANSNSTIDRPSPLSIFKGHTGSVHALVAFESDTLVSASADHTIKVWDWHTGKCEFTLQGHTQGVRTLTLLLNGHLASGSEDHSIRIWDLSTQHCDMVLRGHSHWVVCSILLPDGRLASGSVDKTIHIWDTKSGTCEVILKGHTNSVCSMAVLFDGRLATGSADKSIRIWDATTGKCHGILSGHLNTIRTLIVLPDGRLLSGSADHTIRMWNLSSGQYETMLQNDEEIASMDCLDDGRLVSAFFRVVLWDVGLRIVTHSTSKSTASSSEQTIESAVPAILIGESNSPIDSATTSLDIVSTSALTSPNECQDDHHNSVSIPDTKNVPIKPPKPPKSHGNSIKSESSSERNTTKQEIKDDHDTPKESMTPTECVTDASASVEAQDTAVTLVKMRGELQRIKSEAAIPTPAELSKELRAIQVQLATALHATRHEELSETERLAIRRRIELDQIQEAELQEQYTISSNKECCEYYTALKRRIAEITVAALSIGSGYVDVNNSDTATAVNWICSAVATAFPGASVVSGAVSLGVSYVDAKHRELVLEKMSDVFGSTVHESEIMGEKLARLLVRAYFHSNVVSLMSKETADNDASALISVIITTNPNQHSHDLKHTAEELVRAIWERKRNVEKSLHFCTCCLDPITHSFDTHNTVGAETVANRDIVVIESYKESVFDESAHQHPAATTGSNKSTTVSIEEIMRKLEESEQERRHQAEEMEALKERLQCFALKSDVASKRELSKIAEDVKKLSPAPHSAGGQVLASPHPKDELYQHSASESALIQSRLAVVEAHLHSLTETIEIFTEDLNIHTESQSKLSNLPPPKPDKLKKQKDELLNRI